MGPYVTTFNVMYWFGKDKKHFKTINLDDSFVVKEPSTNFHMYQHSANNNNTQKQQTDNGDADYLAVPRKWDIGNIFKFMVFIGPISSIFDYATYGLMYFVFHATTPGQAALFQTGWFVESLLSQTLIIHIIRTGRIPFLQSHASGPLMLTSLAICAVGVWLPYSPFAHSLGFVPLPLSYWPFVIAIVLAYLSLTHVVKTWFIRKFGLT